MLKQKLKVFADKKITVLELCGVFNVRIVFGGGASMILDHEYIKIMNYLVASISSSLGFEGITMVSIIKINRMCDFQVSSFLEVKMFFSSMISKQVFFLTTIFSLGISAVQADVSGFNSNVEFTQEEIAQHKQYSNALAAASSSCLNATLQFHQDFYAKHQISPFYGDRSRFGRMSYRDQKAELRARGLPSSLIETLKPTSCIGLVLKCLGTGFESTGQVNLWNRIKEFVKANGQDGLALQSALGKLGWKVLYWNPKTKLNMDWDRMEYRADPDNSKRFWGYHNSNWRSVLTTGKYLYNKVGDTKTMVDFGTTPPEEIQRVPFFVGTAHGGYHVFPGAFGQVVEAHSMREIDDPQTVESAEFNPLKDGGAPRGNYFSGLLAFPPQQDR